MAKAKQTEEKEDKAKKARVSVRKKEQTVRQRAERAGNARPKRIRTTAGKVKKLNVLKGRKYKGLRIRGRRIRFIPLFLVNAFKEVRQVTWPTWRETWSLTIAVFIFAVVFAAFVGILDYGLGKLFKEVIIK